MFNIRKLLGYDDDQQKVITNMNQRLDKLRKENLDYQFEEPMSILRRLPRTFMGNSISSDEYGEALEIIEELKRILILCNDPRKE